MATSKKNRVERIKHTLDLDDKIDLHIKGWKVQRIGWVLILSLMLAAALGVFGHGVVSEKRVELGNSKITYERFSRYEAEMELQFTVSDAAPTQVSFSQNYIKNFRVDQIVPQPKENFTRSGRVVYVFDGDAPKAITFYLMAERSGAMHGEVGVNNEYFNLSQFIYP